MRKGKEGEKVFSNANKSIVERKKKIHFFVVTFLVLISFIYKEVYEKIIFFRIFNKFFDYCYCIARRMIYFSVSCIFTMAVLELTKFKLSLQGQRILKRLAMIVVFAYSLMVSIILITGNTFLLLKEMVIYKYVFGCLGALFVILFTF